MKKKLNFLKKIDLFKESPGLLVSRKINSTDKSKRQYMDKMGSLYGGCLTIIAIALSTSILLYLIN